MWQLKNIIKLKKDKFNIKEETLKYLKQDLVLLSKIMHKFTFFMLKKYNVNIKPNYSLSGIVLKLFQITYYNIPFNIRN